MLNNLVPMRPSVLSELDPSTVASVVIGAEAPILVRVENVVMPRVVNRSVAVSAP